MMIREATADDAFDVLMLAHQFGKEAPACFKFNKQKVEAFFEHVLIDPTMVWFVSEDKDGLSGFIIGAVPDHPFNSVRVAVELGWFVTKEKRRGVTGIRLLQTFERWAKEQSAAWTSISDVADIQDLGRLYTRQGYKLTERAYTKELN